MLYLKNSVQSLNSEQKYYPVVATLFSLFLGLLFLCSGCASLERKKVEFINPYTILPVTRVAPDESESKGVLLRLKPQPHPVTYREVMQLFTQIKDGTAVPLTMTKQEELSFKEGSSSDSFILSSRTKVLENDSQVGSEELELDSRGTILNFINGKLKTEYGDMVFLSHKRSAIFPTEPVSIGDKWSYDEEVDMKFDSAFVDRTTKEPDKISVECKLDGFALFDGIRCAVISTKAITHKLEHYSALWKDMDFDINIYANEMIYFDYKRGLVLGRTMKTDSYSTSKSTEFSDISRSQSVSIIEKDAKKE